MSHRPDMVQLFAHSGQPYLGDDVCRQWVKNHEVLPGMAKKYIQQLIQMQTGEITWMETFYK